MPIQALLVNIPAMSNFEADYKGFKDLAQGQGQFLFNLVMTPQSYIDARVARVNLGLPPVAGVAEACYNAVMQQNALPWNDRTKQYIWALVSALMVANGFRTIDQAKDVPHPAFTVAELHEL